MYRPSGGWWFAENTFITSLHRVVNFWLFGIIMKIIPCVAMVIFSSVLLHIMCKADREIKQLKAMDQQAEYERHIRNRRMTAMLVSVVLSFVIAELPQGILALLSGVDSTIFVKVYVPLGDVWDILALLNSSVNFILYCTMSQQFRKTSIRIFLVCYKKKSMSTVQSLHTKTSNVKLSD